MTEQTETLEKVISTKKPEIAQTLPSIKDMLKAGVHFGHKTMRWNAKMAPYIYGEKNKLHIIDLTQTSILLKEATKIVYELAKVKGRILFVATKKQATQTIAEEATRCGQFYVNKKWLGGMLTNWKTVSKSIKTLQEIEDKLADKESTLTKKENLMLERRKDKLDRNLGGIRNMNKYPDLLFVIDTNRESIAIAEAKALNIPVMAIIDTNSNPDLIDYPIPGNDDSIKAIKLYCKAIADAIIAGTEEFSTEKGAIIKKKEAKAPAKKTEEKAPAKKVEPKTVTLKTEKAPAKTVEAKAPAKEAEVKAPTKVVEVATPAVAEKAKAPVKTEVKAPAKKAEAKAPAKAKAVKTPAKKVEAKAPAKKATAKKTTKK